MDSLLHNVTLRIVKSMDAVLITIPFAACWYLVYAPNVAAPYYDRGNWLIVGIYLVIYIIYGRVYEGFMVSLYRISEMVYSQGLAAFITDAILYLITWLLTQHLPSVWPLLLTFIMQLLICGTLVVLRAPVVFPYVPAASYCNHLRSASWNGRFDQ